MGKDTKYAILSFSGGLDSTSLLINLLYNKFDVQCITFDYGQNHLIEIEKAKLNIKYLNSNGFSGRLKHRVVNIKDAFNSNGSSLFRNSEDVPRGTTKILTCCLLLFQIEMQFLHLLFLVTPFIPLSIFMIKSDVDNLCNLFKYFLA